MRALVTGASGFLGSSLTRLLVRAGHRVAILCRPESDLWRIADVLGGVARIQVELLGIEEAAGAIRQFAPEAVFHLAWHGVGNRHRDDFAQITRNLASSLALLRIARDSGCRVWVGLGSQAEYGPHNRLLDEEAETAPTTLYGAAKLCTYLLSRQLCSATSMRLVWLRLFSCYGPADNPDWLIPQLIARLLEGRGMALTEGVQRWDYLYVTDAARACYLAAQTPGAQGVYNLGSGQAYPIRSIAERIRNAIDPTLPLGFGEIAYRPDQVMHLQAEITRLQAATAWKPRVGLEAGLRRTIQWYRKRHNAGRNT